MPKLIKLEVNFYILILKKDFGGIRKSLPPMLVRNNDDLRCLLHLIDSLFAKDFFFWFFI